MQITLTIGCSLRYVLDLLGLVVCIYKSAVATLPQNHLVRLLGPPCLVLADSIVDVLGWGESRLIFVAFAHKEGRGRQRST